jgi:UDP-2-acetamido-2-deoxy-ribo-hexuluronate aminotransferase
MNRSTQEVIMQFIDLHKQYSQIEEAIHKGMDEVFRHKKFIMGPEVTKLEEKLATYLDVKHAIACSNGTDALVLAMRCYGLSKSDAVFVPSFSFFASAETISLAGATPVFVDSDNTYNMCPIALEKAVENVKSKGELIPKGIIAVDLFGLPADYKAIQKIADDYDLFLLEDGAQGFGGVYNGKKACSFGDIATTSFFPAKPLGCYGDGGAIFTKDDDIAKHIKSLRVHGKGDHKYDNVRVGYNARLDTMQAVVLLAKLEIFDNEMRARNVVAAEYSKRLGSIFKTPVVPENCISAWAQYTLIAITHEQREHILAKLKESSIPTMVYYPTPIHLSSAYANLGYKCGDLPNAESFSERVFSLPMHPYLTEQEIDIICTQLTKAAK